MHPDPASFNAPETFTRTIGLGESLRRRRAPMILALLLVGLLGSLAFINAGSPLNVVTGGLAGLALAAAIGWFGHLSDRSTVGTATLVLESEGLRYEDAGTHRAPCAGRTRSTSAHSRLPTVSGAPGAVGSAGCW
ncbi:MAG: hypothetical protein HZY73_01905 [Micropruina sp.]|nr:MAG: hypothetical protein HZY73_01905 [Micropruina sp.]